MRDHYSAIVVGSGYGGAIVADRIARAGRDVCVLERGRELHPGQYPDSALSAAREIQVQTPKSHYGAPAGLLDFHVSPGVTVVTGCGLGGTSLINAGVALEPGEDVLADKAWPEPLRNDTGALRRHMATARKMLGSTPYPRDWPELPKLTALERAAQGLGSSVRRPDLNVTFEAGPNWAGVTQNACTLCGDCCSGCNYGAKNTVLMNYLPDAQAHGAQIFTEVAVRTVNRWREPGSGRQTWRVDLEAVPGSGPGPDGPDTVPEFITADVVVLAAGTLGTTQILLRSAGEGLPVSDRLGRGFSTNGDVLAFAYDTDGAVAGVGTGTAIPRQGRLVGPTIAGMIDLRTPGQDRKDALIIEDGAIPGALAAVLPLALSAAASGIPQDGTRRLAELAGIPFGARHGATSRTLTYLVMSTDDADGQIVLEDGRARVAWPEAGEEPAFTRDNDILARATRALNGTELPDPLWAWTHGNSLITVHPLGGCVMADDASGGVVDHKGRVFDPSRGASGDGSRHDGAVHEGLYVCDGSVVPLALDVNPLLTISALAERTAEHLLADHQWTAAGPTHLEGTGPGPAPVPDVAVPQVSLAFDEVLTGFMSMRVHEGYADGYARGRADGTRVELHLTIAWADIHAVLADTTVPAAISGTVTAPDVSAAPLTVTDGRFTLLEPDPDRVEAWRMTYEMTLLAQDGTRYRFQGYKNIREHGARHAWADTTTLYSTITRLSPDSRIVGAGEADEIRGMGGKGEVGHRAGTEPGSQEPGTGVLHLRLADLTRLIASIRISGAEPGWQGRYRRAFLELFAGEMVHIYGGVLDETADFPAVPVSPKQAPVREPKDPDGTWWCDGGHRWHYGDTLGGDAFLRLTRYRAGDKGPLLLATGFGMSSHSFLTSTIDQNLTEFLAAQGYDIWLFDYRAGIDLPSARTEFTIDDIARTDWHLAVAKVQEETGRENVQAFGHCVGSGSLLMALATGLPGVRAAVCAQFPLHPTTSVFNRAKARLHLGDLFLDARIRGVSPDNRLALADEALDVALRTLPMPEQERCGQAVCRWINGVYGMTHRHAQLNDATHEALNEMFGFGNSESLDQLLHMLGAGRALTNTGGDDYLSHPELLADKSILLLQGRENYIFHPAGTRRTLHWLVEHNPQGDYERVVLPGYAHLDAIVGARAAVDVFPVITNFLSRR
jgi:cholesterol oxidase